MQKPKVTLSADEARNLALLSQGFGAARAATPTQALDEAHVLQIDSVNVFARSHYMPAFARVGPYDRDGFDSELWRQQRYTEYWAHEAAFIAVEDRHLFSWRMHDFKERFKKNGQLDAQRKLVAKLKSQLAELGPSSAKDLEEGPRSRRGQWWDWSETKHALEMLFAMGELISAGRENFVRRYALQHHLPAEALKSTKRAEAQMLLIQKAALAMGVATAADLADYFRIKQTEANVAIKGLQEAGVLLPVRVEGWLNARAEAAKAWVHRDAMAKIGLQVPADALLSPFDTLVWYRPRVERIFGFHYRLEIYTPKQKRKFGYYSLPLLVDGQLQGRLDLKADRKAGVLLVQGAWQEEGAPAHTALVANRLLLEAAKWQGLAEICDVGVGDLRL